MKLIKYFLQKRSVTLLLLLLIFFGGLFAYAKWVNSRMLLSLSNKPWY